MIRWSNKVVPFLKQSFFQTINVTDPAVVAYTRSCKMPQLTRFPLRIHLFFS